jgi:hypothetical protein
LQTFYYRRYEGFDTTFQPQGGFMTEGQGPDIVALLRRSGAGPVAYRGFRNPPLRQAAGRVGSTLPAPAITEPATAPEQPPVAAAEAAPPVITLPFAVAPAPVPPAATTPVAPLLPLPLIEAALSGAARPGPPAPASTTLARLRAAAG